MKKIVGLFVSMFFALFGFGQDYHEEFMNYCQSGDTVRQLKTLIAWEDSKGDDPDLYASFFNYYYSKSQKEILAVMQGEPNGDALIISDTTNDALGFIGSQVYFDEEMIAKAHEKIDKGIKLYPNRLDLRFGKVYALGETKNWEEFTAEIIKAIRVSASNGNNWTWTRNELKKMTAEEFLLDIQTYQIQLYNTGDDRLLSNMRDIANEVLKHYPNHIESLSNLSITYFLTEDYDKGIETLKKAEEINPSDDIVLTNIANGYSLKGEINLAIEYYEKAIEFGDDRTKEFAKQKITELKK